MSVPTNNVLQNDRTIIFVHIICDPHHRMRHKSHTKVLSKWLNKEKIVKNFKI